MSGAVWCSVWQVLLHSVVIISSIVLSLTRSATCCTFLFNGLFRLREIFLYIWAEIFFSLFSKSVFEWAAFLDIARVARKSLRVARISTTERAGNPPRNSAAASLDNVRVSRKILAHRHAIPRKWQRIPRHAVLRRLSLILNAQRSYDCTQTGMCATMRRHTSACNSATAYVDVSCVLVLSRPTIA